MIRDFQRIVTFLLLLSSLLLGTVTAEARGTVPHGPIVIEGDSGFTRENGVVSGSGTVVDPYTIQGWEITGVDGTAITVKSTSAHFVIKKVWVHHNKNGVLFIDVRNGKVENSIVSHSGTMRGEVFNGVAVSLARSSQNTIVGNRILWNELGIEIGGGLGNIVENNIVKNNLAGGIHLGSLFIPGLGWSSGGSGNIIRSNIVSDSGFGDGPGGKCCGVGIALGGTTDGTIAGNFIFNNDFGISTFGDSRIQILGNRIVQHGTGIRLSDGEQVSIRNNHVIGGLFGVTIDFGRNHAVVGNEIRDVSASGLQMTATRGHIVRDNLVVSTGFLGIALTNTASSSIVGNNVRDSPVGIFIEFLSRDNLISNNVVRNASFYSLLVFATTGPPNLVRDNKIQDSPRGVWIHSSSNNVVEGNLVQSVPLPISVFCMSSVQLAGNTIRENTLIDFSVPSVIRPDVCIDTLPNFCFVFPSACVGFYPFFPPPPIWSQETLALSNTSTVDISEASVELFNPETGETITSLDWGAALQGTVIGRALLVRNTSDAPTNVTISGDLPPEFGKLFIFGELVCEPFFPYSCAPSNDVLPQTLTVEAGEEFILGLFWKVPKDAPVGPVSFTLSFA